MSPWRLVAALTSNGTGRGCGLCHTYTAHHASPDLQRYRVEYLPWKPAFGNSVLDLSPISSLMLETSWLAPGGLGNCNCPPQAPKTTNKTFKTQFLSCVTPDTVRQPRRFVYRYRYKIRHSHTMSHSCNSARSACDQRQEGEQWQRSIPIASDRCIARNRPPSVPSPRLGKMTLSLGSVANEMYACL